MSKAPLCARLGSNRGPKMVQWQKSREFKRLLIADEWKTPDTYGNEFEIEPDGPGIYLFLSHDSDTFLECFPAYVGMSKRVQQRWQGHSVLSVLSQTNYWCQKWFKHVTPSRLRDIERTYINKFEPPFNLIGIKRGLCLL